jgi:cation diffusion facilitator family transporter
MTDMKKQEQNETADLAMQVSAVSIAVNIGLSLLKLLAGLIARSGAMISDAVHSASDVFSTIVVIVGVQMAKKKPDKEHPYGHERMECVASVILAIVLAATGIGIGYQGIQKITAEDEAELAVPGILALSAAVVSVIVKELMFRYTRRAANQLNSGALLADAWHQASADIYSRSCH